MIRKIYLFKSKDISHHQYIESKEYFSYKIIYIFVIIDDIESIDRFLFKSTNQYIYNICKNINIQIDLIYIESSTHLIFIIILFFVSIYIYNHLY